MTDDYCASLCLHWAQAGSIPGATNDEVYSGTQFSYTCWCGTAADASKLVRVDEKQCNTPCEGDKSMVCGGPSLNHVMRVSCSRWGWTFVWSLVACLVGYTLVGALYTHRSQGVPFTKAEFLAGSLLPNQAFWKVLHGLVTDGVRFSRAKLRGEASVPADGYTAVAGNARTSGSGGKKQSSREETETDERHSSKGGSSKKKHAREKHGKGVAEASKRGSRSGGGKSREQLEERGCAEVDVAGGEDAEASARELLEQREAADGLHASQAKIKVVGINSK